MRADVAAPWPRTLLALLAVLALLLGAAPLAGAQEDDGPRVECETEIDEDGDPVVRPGDEVECTAFGLETGEEAPDVEWYVNIWGWTWDDEEFEEEEYDGEDDRRAEDDGTMTFSFVVPAEIFFGVFEGEVLQGDGYAEEFFGFIFPHEGEMVCEPDPVEHGEQVTCTASGMNPGEEFQWQVWFYSEELFFDDEEEFLEDEEFEEEEPFEPDVSGQGTADGDGVGVFEFMASTDPEMDHYFAVAWQEPDYVAFYDGHMSTEEPEEEEEHAEPAPVQRPTRVETGAGGSWPGSGSPLAVILVGVMAAGAAAVLRLRTTRG